MTQTPFIFRPEDEDKKIYVVKQEYILTVEQYVKANDEDEAFNIFLTDGGVKYEDIGKHLTNEKFDECETEVVDIDSPDIKTNIFKKGIYDNIDKINDDYVKAYNELIKIVDFISNIDDSLCKIDFNEREGYYISITKKRYDNALKKSKDYMNKFEKKLLVKIQK
jgi:hypothetical protein